jgi:hypothetical protein
MIKESYPAFIFQISFAGFKKRSSMRNILTILLLGLLSLPVIAQQPAGKPAKPKSTATQALPSDAATPEQIQKLFELLKVRETTETLMHVALQQAKENGMEMIRESIPDQTPEEQKNFSDMMDRLTGKLNHNINLDEMFAAMIPVYQKHLTKTDIDSIVAFYASPTGQHFLQEQPKIVQESTEALAPIQKRLMQQLMSDMKDEVQKAVEEKKQTAPAQPAPAKKKS